MKAILNNYRQSPRKVRLVADVVRGKTVKDAVLTLSFLPKRASLAVKKLIESAFANISNAGSAVKIEDVFIKKITVDEGVTMKRFMPKWRGTAHRINKRSSKICVELAPKKMTK